MKRIIATVTSAVLAATALTACSSSPEGDDAAAANEPLTVLASASPHLEILEWIDENHDEFELDVTPVSGGPEANMGVADGSVDLNFFQHEPYLVNWEQETGKDLEIYAQSHIEPISIYSRNLTSLDELQDGATIVVPNNPSNYARSLLLLQSAGLIKLDADVDPANVAKITDADISENPKNLDIKGVEGEIAAFSLDDNSVSAAVINSNYAMEAGLDPVNDPIYTESPVNNPYVNILVGLPGLEDDARVTALAEALQ